VKLCWIGATVRRSSACQERSRGAWLFKGTRVPVAALFENLEGGATVDDFLEWFQGVTREQVESVLKHAEQSLTVA
jgi:uncharacterized protein (DUF433 family)